MMKKIVTIFIIVSCISLEAMYEGNKKNDKKRGYIDEFNKAQEFLKRQKINNEQTKMMAEDCNVLLVAQKDSGEKSSELNELDDQALNRYMPARRSSWPLIEVLKEK